MMIATCDHDCCLAKPNQNICQIIIHGTNWHTNEHANAKVNPTTSLKVSPDKLNWSCDLMRNEAVFVSKVIFYFILFFSSSPHYSKLWHMEILCCDSIEQLKGHSYSTSLAPWLWHFAELCSIRNINSYFYKMIDFCFFSFAFILYLYFIGLSDITLLFEGEQDHLLPSTS